MNVAVSTQLPQPLYAKIRENLRRQILDGDYAPHARLPSEKSLMACFGVSRITIRQALNDLYNEGLVFSAQGKGTYVCKPKAVQNVQRLQGFIEAMVAQGYDASSRVLGIDIRRAPRAVSRALRLEAGSEVVEVRRVRCLAGEPICVENSFFPEAIGRRLFDLPLSGDIFPLLEGRLGLSLGAADLSLDAVLCDDEAQQHLSLAADEPVLRVERLTHDRAGRPVDFEYLRFRGDSFKYHFRVDRK